MHTNIKLKKTQKRALFCNPPPTCDHRHAGRSENKCKHSGSSKLFLCFVYLFRFLSSFKMFPFSLLQAVQIKDNKVRACLFLPRHLFPAITTNQYHHWHPSSHSNFFSPTHFSCCFFFFQDYEIDIPFCLLPLVKFQANKLSSRAKEMFYFPFLCELPRALLELLWSLVRRGRNKNPTLQKYINQFVDFPAHMT